jgi:hypothetical protein
MAYQPMTIAGLAGHLSSQDDEKIKWKYVWEFLEEYRWEPAARQPGLFRDEPPLTGDEQWDALLAALAEHLAVFDHPGIRVMAASPEHVFAMKAFAARGRDEDDLRALARIIGISTVDAALAVCELPPRRAPAAQIHSHAGGSSG